MVKPLSWIAIALAVALMLASMLLTVSSGSATEMGGDQPTSTVIPTATPTPCPVATQASLYVDPVTSPTDRFSQVISIGFGGEWVAVSAESGTFYEEGARSRWEVNVDLLPNTIHHLAVTGYVPPDNVGSCRYGGYHVFTRKDIRGTPLVIEQIFNPDYFNYLSLIRRGTTPTSTPTPTPTPTIPPIEDGPFRVEVVPSKDTLFVGETLEVRAYLFNETEHTGFGEPRFQPLVLPEGQEPSALEPVRPEPVTFWGSVAPGGSTSADFTFQTVRPGTVKLSVSIVGELFVGSAGYYTHGSAGGTSEPVIVIEPYEAYLPFMIHDSSP